MTDPGTLLFTGASGTVGSALLDALGDKWAGPILAIGRHQPRSFVDGFHEADLADPSGVDRARALAAKAQPPVTGMVFAAGVDCRATLRTATRAQYERTQVINCVAPLLLLGAAMARARQAMRVVLTSSDVVSEPQPETLVYAASKAALDSAVEHAAAEDERLRVLILRLPNLGTPMVDVDGQRQASTGPPTPALDRACATACEFLTSPDEPARVRTWTDA